MNSYVNLVMESFLSLLDFNTSQVGVAHTQKYFSNYVNFYKALCFYENIDIY